MLTILLALILPFLMMLFFTKVSYSKIGALIVTLMVLIFALDGLQQTPVAIFAAVASIVIGFIVSSHVQKRNRGV